MYYFIAYLHEKYDFITVTIINSWMISIPGREVPTNSTKIEPPWILMSPQYLLHVYISNLVFLLSLFVIKAHEIYLAPTSATTEENSTYMLVQLLRWYQYTTTTVDLGYYMYNIPERLYSKHITLHLVSTKHFAYQMALKKSAYSTFNNIFVTKFIKSI